MDSGFVVKPTQEKAENIGFTSGTLDCLFRSGGCRKHYRDPILLSAIQQCTTLTIHSFKQLPCTQHQAEVSES